mgnify:CR=1 FL=1
MNFLTKGDIEKIVDRKIDQVKKEFTEIVQNELKSLVMNEITFEELAKDERTGKLVKTGKKRTETVNLLQFMAERHYGIEGAWRGYQADIDRMKSRMMRNEQIQQAQLQLLGSCANALNSIAERIQIEAPIEKLAIDIPHDEVESNGSDT